jgi:tRNA threonylcarbamoyladenosine biosynthesis protein TsaB
MNLLLAIDTCTSQTSIALRNEERILGEHTWRNDRQHTSATAERIRQMLAQHGATGADVKVVAAALGPGSFTGVRVGLAIAKGMAAANGAALIGVSAFDILAAAQMPRMSPFALPILAVVEAGRERVAVQRYVWEDGAEHKVGGWSLMAAAEFAKGIQETTWVCGDLPQSAYANAHVRCAPAPLNVRRAAHLAEIAYARWKRGDVDNPATLMPIYPPEG